MNRLASSRVMPLAAFTFRRNTVSNVLTSSCKVDGCDGEHYALELCSIHYRRQYRGGPLDPDLVHSGATHRTNVTPWRYV